MTQFVPMRQFAHLLGADDPENIAQEAFVRVHRRWGNLRESGKALAYLRRTVANLATSRLRHLMVSRKHPVAPPADVASAETSALDGFRHSVLWRGIEGLPRRQRQVVVLRYWLDVDVAEVAAVGEPSASDDRYPDGQGCHVLEAVPNDPLLSQLSALPATDDGPSPLPDLTVWVTVPEVAEISVVRAGGDTITATSLGMLQDLKVFVTSKSIADAQRYTFRDANGTVLRDDQF